ncbi:MAG: dihydrodipicolinate reductase [Actinomycetota bacterium]
MTFRVVQWATGGVGRAAIAGIAEHPDLELVGCWVHSADKIGVDAGTLAGVEPLGVKATDDVDALMALRPDCVLYSPIFADASLVRRFLSAGINVVTPVGWINPSPEERAELDALCTPTGATLHGTGIHPGGVTELLPLVLSSLSGSVTHVRAEEFSDIRTYGAPDVIRDWMLFGATPEAARGSIMLAALGTGFGQSVRLVAEALGVQLDDELRAVHELAVSTAPIDSPIGPIEPGLVAAQRFTWQGTVDGEPVVTAAVNWFMGETDLDPAWTFGPEGERFEVEVTGDPGCSATFHGWHPPSIAEGLRRNPGIVATAQHCVNSVPVVCAADPGVRTFVDLPIVTGRIAPHLRR